MSYGKELILDLHNCDPKTFTRKSLRSYFQGLCELIDMEAEKIVFWDDVGVPKSERQTDPRTKGTSAVQFILTSNITVHTLDLMGKVFVNLFSCDKFNAAIVSKFTRQWFKGKIVSSRTFARL